MEHVSKVLDRVYTELQAKSDKNKELNHEILSLETAQKLADYEKLKKRIKTMVKKAKLKDDLIYEGKAEMQNKFDIQTIELDKANEKLEKIKKYMFPIVDSPYTDWVNVKDHILEIIGDDKQ